jgi:integrase
LVKQIHEQDLDIGYGGVYLPNALARKYQNAAKDFRRQYVFPSKKLSTDPRSKTVRRHHVLESGLQKAVKEDGVNIRVVQELMGHADVKTTEI